MKTARLIALVGLLFVQGVLRAQAPTRPGLPLAPTELLTYLPAAPLGWSLKESKATSFLNEWLVSQATRLFELSSKDVVPSGTPPAPVTRIRLTDTGFYPALFADFEAFKVGKYGTMESLFIGTYPARRAILPEGERLRVLLRNRFIIEIETRHQKPNAGLVWLQQFDLARLTDAPVIPVAKLPNPLQVSIVDEINPRANSSYEVSSSSDEELAEARSRKP